MKTFIKQLCPPVLWNSLKSLRNENMWRIINKRGKSGDPVKQELDIYWDKEFVTVLETWGDGTVWNEIQFLMSNCQGKVLDIACGTGRNIDMLSKKFPDITVYGCDISEKLIEKAEEKGISRERLRVCDAVKTGYEDKYFNYAYSIGSFEHFTEEGIANVIKECRRITKDSSFHFVPISRNGKNEGWVKTREQSYFNNGLDWWLSKFKLYYTTIYALDSAWESDQQIGKWFICVNR